MAQADWFAIPSWFLPRSFLDMRAILPVPIMFTSPLWRPGDISGVMEGGMSLREGHR